MQHPKKAIDIRLRTAADMALRAVHDLAQPLILDVGCDHGYLTAYLLRQRQDVFVIASDISGPSLNKARLLLDPGIYGDRVSFREADGLDALKPDEVPNCIVIAGMGGRRILDILSSGMQKLADASLILQANTDVPFVREGLADLGYKIEKEAFVQAAQKQYVILQAAKGEGESITKEEAVIGKASATDGAGKEAYLLALLQKKTEEMRQAAYSRTEKGLSRISALTKECGWIAEELKMKNCTVQNVFDLVDSIAPFETAEDWDNAGLLIGSMHKPVKKILIALDATQEVLAEAKELNCELIVTHHPLMFRPVQRLTDDSREGSLILSLVSEGFSLISAHTNLDKAKGGVNDALMQQIGIRETQGDGFVRVGQLQESCSFADFCSRVQAALQAQLRVYGNALRPIRTVGCCSGAGGDEYKEALRLGADCFLTGEIHHHVVLNAMQDNCPIIEAGHYETEKPVCDSLRSALQMSANRLKYNLTFFSSSVNPFECSR